MEGLRGDVLPVLQQLRMVCSSGCCSARGGYGGEDGEDIDEMRRKELSYFYAKSTKYQVCSSVRSSFVKD